MKEKTVAKYPKFCATVEPILVAFCKFVNGENVFSYVHYLLSKQKSTYNIWMWWFVAQIQKTCNLIFVISSLPTKSILHSKNSNLQSFCLNVEQGCMNGVPNATHLWRFVSLAC